MTRTITLTKDVRLFVRRMHGSLQLVQACKKVLAGTELEIEEAETMYYDHRNQLAVPTMIDGVESFFLLSEMGHLNAKRAS